MNREQLVQDIDQGLRIQEMADKYGKAPQTIRQWLWKNGLKAGRANDSLRAQALDDIQKSMVLGMLMGDSYINKHGALLDEHSVLQEELVLWRAKLLDPFVSKIRRVDKKFGKIVRLETIAHPHFKDLRSMVYQEGVKRVPSEVISQLDLFALANWYADDGTLFQRKLVRFLLAGNTPEEDVMRFCIYLNSSWEMKCKAWKNNRQNVWAVTSRYAPSKRLLQKFRRLDLPQCLNSKLGLNP